MTKRRMHWRTLQVVSGSAALILAVSACGTGAGSSSNPGSSTSEPAAMCAGTSDPHASIIADVQQDSKLASEVPKEWQGKELTIATDGGDKIFESIAPGGSIAGVDPLVVSAVAKVLGLRCRYQVTDYAGLIPALQARKYDAATAGMRDQKAREGVLDFVNYTATGSVMVVPKGNPKNITGMESMCGKRMVYTRGVDPKTFEPESNDFCAKSGRSPVQTSSAPGVGEVILAVKAGNVDAGWVGASVGEAAVKESNGALQLITPTGRPRGYVPGLIGIVFPKDSTLVKPVCDAVKSLISDGHLASIFDAYGVKSMMLDKCTVNVSSTEPLLPDNITAN